MPHDDPYRLPRNVAPDRYDLELVVDPGRPDFDGTVTIGVEVLEPVERILLNAVDLELRAVEVVGGDDDPRHPEVLHDPGTERVELRFDSPLPPGTARIGISFSGRYCDDLVGLYRSTFTVGDAEHHLAVTQFEATNARRAFPCFDEPDMKAVFGVRLVVPDGLLAVSNAAELDREICDDGSVRVRFADTMVMSTYLVAVVVGPLMCSDTTLVDGRAGEIPLRVICPPGSEHLSPFALEVAAAGLRFFEDYYDLPYPGDKVDLVAIPDFAFGAMENLGCITFREVVLLVDPEEVTQPELQRVADVINHELAHMWFGDLVTMSWWNGIWLNEAFATFMEVTASDAFRPEWDVWTGFGLARAAAFDTDALTSTRPIEFPVHSPTDAEAMFDILTYEKGASVLRMLERYLGADRFRDAIRAYLRANAHANTDTTDLWDALERSTGEPIRRIMDAWILHGGHPVVTAEVTGSVVELTQSPATLALESGAWDDRSADLGSSWPVPLVVTATTSGTVVRRRVLVEDATMLDLGTAPTSLQLNTGGDGFFRSAVPPALRAAGAVDPTASPLERFVLLDDTWAALLRGDATGEDVEALVELLSWRETDPWVWRRLAQVIRDLHRLRGAGHDDRAALLAVGCSETALRRVEELLQVVGPDAVGRWQDLRGVLFTLLGTVGRDGTVRTLAHELFRAPPEEARRRPGVDSTLVVAALDVVAATGTEADHRVVEHRWRTATNPQDTIRYLHALADTPVEACFRHLLDLAITEVRPQDTAYVLRRALGHRVHAEVAWEFVSSRWDDVMDKVPSSAAVRMLEGIRGVTSIDTAERIEAFLATHPTPSGSRVCAQHVERMWVTVHAADRLRVELDTAPSPGGAMDPDG